MTKNIKNELIDKVLEPIHDAGFTVAFVGGCVRDKLMDVEPHDFDITTDATPEELHKIFDRFSNVSENSEPFGVTMPLIEFDDGTVEEVEIATFRKDITKGRHPKIEFTRSIEEDAARRDFTVNALYEDMFGNIIDPTGQGKDDIRTNTLRFIGNAQDRISEDPLRIFRFVRFLASKGFMSAHDVREAMEWKADFTDVSKERVLKELEKTFGGKFLFTPVFDQIPFNFFLACRIDEKIGMRQIMVDMSNIEQSWMWHAEGSSWWLDNGQSVAAEDIADFSKATPKMHGNVWDHTLRVMKLMSKETQNDPDEHHRFVLMMAAFLHDIGKVHSKLGVKTNILVFNGKEFAETIPKVTDHDIVGAPIAKQFCKDIGMTNIDSELVFNLVKNHMRVHRLSEMKSKTSIWKMVSKSFFGDLVKIAKCDENGCIKTSKDEWSGIEKSLEKPNVKELLGVKMPKPVITGDDLIASGLKPDKSFAKRLDVAYTFQIDHDCKSKDKLLKIAKGITMPKEK